VIVNRLDLEESAEFNEFLIDSPIFALALTTGISTVRRALRRHVLNPLGGTHQIFGGGVPIILMCFRTFKNHQNHPKSHRIITNFTHRNRFLSEVVAIHGEFLVFLQSSIEEDDDLHLGGLKGGREQLHELKASIELATASPIY
jgi:hypothetical protein